MFEMIGDAVFKITLEHLRAMLPDDIGCNLHMLFLADDGACEDCP